MSHSQVINSVLQKRFLTILFSYLFLLFSHFHSQALSPILLDPLSPHLSLQFGQLRLVTLSRPQPKENRLFLTRSGQSRSRWSCPQFQHPVILSVSHSSSATVRGSGITGRGSGIRKARGAESLRRFRWLGIAARQNTHVLQAVFCWPLHPVPDRLESARRG